MSKKHGVYQLGTLEGWDAFQVARFHGVEEISRPYDIEVIVLRARERGPADLDALVNAAATLRIASRDRWRVVHGILTEAEELDRTPTQTIYRLVLAPPIVRARHRRRCRNFVDRTLEDVITAVLENRSPAHPNGNGGLTKLEADPAPLSSEPDFGSFTEPRGFYKLALSDRARIQDAKVSPYIVQYNESDFDFLSRLLEREGISYTFEHAEDGVIMVLSDLPGQSPLLSAPTTLEMRSMMGLEDAHAQEEVVKRLRDTRRLRSSNVVVRQFDWKRSHSVLEGQDSASDDEPDALGAFEFTGEDEELGADPGKVPAKVRMERLRAERELREGLATVRTMEAGRRYTIEDADHQVDDIELLIVRIETTATAMFPQGTVLDSMIDRPRGSEPNHEVRFQALPTSVPFRPEQRTKKPRIHGVQMAIVTAEELPSGSAPEINCDKMGNVRVRFPWDQRKNQDDGTPTSNWIRVSQYWAGISYGALHNPRVGHEVLVAYVQGDPDRPIVVGRVYNAQNPPPYDPSKEPTKSTVKSRSSPNDTGFNEIRFEDKAKAEEIYLHAQKDLNEVVLANHSTSVGGDQSNTVGHDQTNTVYGDRTHKVQGDEVCLVQGNRTHVVIGTEDVTVDADRTTHFNANETHVVAANESRTIGANRTTTVAATDELTTSIRITTVNACDASFVTGPDMVTVGGPRTVVVGGPHFVNSAHFVSVSPSEHAFVSPSFTVNGSAAVFEESAAFVAKAGSATLSMSPGVIIISNGAGACIALVGGMILTSAGSPIISVAGGPMANIAGGPIAISAGGDVDVKGSTIKLNG